MCNESESLVFPESFCKKITCNVFDLKWSHDKSKNLTMIIRVIVYLLLYALPGNLQM